MSKKTTVLFDFDGTIMNTNQVIINSWQHTFRTVTGKEQDESVIVRTFGEPLELTMAKFFGGGEAEVAKNIAIYRSYHHDNFGKMITVFPGIRELLDRLTADGYRMALVTSRLKRTTFEGLEHYDLLKYFEYVVTADDTAVHKPNPEPINIALRKLGVSADESVMIGDTGFDMQCAANAGVTSVLVDWSAALPADARTGINKPDYVIKEAMDLIDILTAIA